MIISAKNWEAIPQRKDIYSFFREYMIVMDFHCEIKEENRMEQIEIKSLSLVQLKNVMIEMGEKAFRAKQIYEWLHQKQAESFDEIEQSVRSLG